MKKYMDKLKSKIRFNKNLFVFLFVIVIVGITSGALFSLLINDSDKRLVTDYLNNFMNNISSKNIDFNSSFLNTSTFTLGFALIIWILGISIIGIIFIIPFLFIKSFIIGFSIGGILVNFKLKGIIISLIYIVPHQVVNMLIYMLISAYAIMISYRIFKSMKNKKTFDFKIVMNKYTFVLVFSLIILFVSTLYEVVILPKLISFLFNLIN